MEKIYKPTWRYGRYEIYDYIYFTNTSADTTNFITIPENVILPRTAFGYISSSDTGIEGANYNTYKSKLDLYLQSVVNNTESLSNYLIRARSSTSIEGQGYVYYEANTVINTNNTGHNALYINPNFYKVTNNTRTQMTGTKTIYDNENFENIHCEIICAYLRSAIQNVYETNTNTLLASITTTDHLPSGTWPSTATNNQALTIYPNMLKVNRIKQTFIAKNGDSTQYPDIAVCDLRPCYDRLEKKYGWYDSISNTFIDLATSGLQLSYIMGNIIDLK